MSQLPLNCSGKQMGHWTLLPQHYRARGDAIRDVTVAVNVTVAVSSDWDSTCGQHSAHCTLHTLSSGPRVPRKWITDPGSWKLGPVTPADSPCESIASDLDRIIGVSEKPHAFVPSGGSGSSCSIPSYPAPVTVFYNHAPYYCRSRMFDVVVGSSISIMCFFEYEDYVNYKPLPIPIIILYMINHCHRATEILFKGLATDMAR